MEMLGFLGAIVGMITAIINRKRIVVLRYEDTRNLITNDVRSHVTIGKRFKRLFIVAVLFLISIAIFGSASSGRPSSEVSSGWVVAPMILLLMGAYQAIAIVILILAKLWR